MLSTQDMHLRHSFHAAPSTHIKQARAVKVDVRAVRHPCLAAPMSEHPLIEIYIKPIDQHLDLGSQDRTRVEHPRYRRGDQGFFVLIPTYIGDYRRRNKFRRHENYFVTHVTLTYQSTVCYYAARRDKLLPT